MTAETYKIGKNILENLTSGMYTDSKFIYREYVQNSADAIDEAVRQNIIDKQNAKILININSQSRTITIEDNATGITQDNAISLLGNVADSMKDKNINKGFRGIGRLGGLAYCKKLVFETSTAGEDVKSVMSWDADLLHKILNDPSDKSNAATVIDRIVDLKTEKENIDEHYFKVSLINVKESNNDLLDKDAIREYLSQVAPVDFNKTIFLLSGKIREEMAAHNKSLDTYNIFINDDSIYKIYQNSLIDTNGTCYDKISDIDYHEFYNNSGELLAWSWVGISKFDKCIPEKNNPQRCIRLKKSNIQLGDADTLSFLHKETRGNGYFIGEVHAIHPKLIPNARRDYFNNNETLLELEAKLREYFNNLYNLYHLANDQKNAIKKQNEYITKKQEYEEKTQTGSFVNAEEQQKELKRLEELKSNAEKAKKISENIAKKAEENQVLKNVVTFIKKDYGNNLEEIPEIQVDLNQGGKKVYRSNKLNKLNREQRKLISKVYDILNQVLDPDTAECVKKKIEEEFS